MMWKNIVQTDGPQVTIWRMLFACWITKATDTHLEYVILIVFFFTRLSFRLYVHCLSCLVLSCYSCKAQYCVHKISSLPSYRAIVSLVLVTVMVSGELRGRNGIHANVFVNP
jgi:hypothetical protein